MTGRWRRVVINSSLTLLPGSQSQFRLNELNKVRVFPQLGFVLRGNGVGSEDAAEQREPGYEQHTSCQSGTHEQERLLKGEDVSMAPGHRRDAGLGVVFFRLRSYGDAVPLMLLLLFFCPAVIRKRWTREQHSD